METSYGVDGVCGGVQTRGRDGLDEEMLVWERIAEKGRRKVGVECLFWSSYSRWRWSKTLRSDDWTMKIMQRGSGGVDLEEP